MNQNKNKELFETTPVARAVSTMAIPTIIGQLIVLIYNMADTFFIGRTNNPYMVAAASLILPVFNITYSVANIAGVGGSALVSRLLGESREEEAKKVFTFCTYLTLIMAGVFAVAVLGFMKPLLLVLGAGRETFDFARSYALCVVVLGGIPTIMTNVLSNFVRSIGESKKAGFGVTMGGVLNILLDPLFMFVLLPEGNEILGAGIATCISNCVSCTYFVITVASLRKKSVLQLVPFSSRPSSESIRRVFAIGVPAAITTLLFDLDYIVLDRLMSGYGDVALAAVGIVLKAERLPLNIGIGICQGMIPIVAYNYASGNIRRMRATIRFSMLSGIACGVVSIALYETFAPNIMQVFINDADTILLGTGFLRVRCLATLFMFLSFFHVHLFNSYSRGGEALFLGIARWAVFNIPMLFLLNHLFGMYGLVWSQLVSDVLNVILSVIVHRRFLKSKNLLHV